MFIALGILALLLALAAAFSLGRSTGSPKIIHRGIFDEQPVHAHPDAELVAENAQLKERVGQLEAIIDADVQEQTYCDMIVEIDKLRQKVASKEKLRARYLRLLRAERATVARMRQTWQPPGFVSPFAGRAVLRMAS